jgi:hypothetical protein
VIEIEEPPDTRACAPCSKPITWLWSPRTQQWVPFHPDTESTRTLHVHGCDVFGDPPPSWRERPTYPPETIHAGAERVRSELERAATKEGT